MKFAAGLLLIAFSCAAPMRASTLASARLAPDFESYTLRRVGLLPLTGAEMDPEREPEMQAAFFAEVSRMTNFEVVALTPEDLEEVPRSEPYRRGGYQPRTVIALARRFRVDALLIGTVTDYEVFPPLKLGVQLDLVASETGLAIWSASVVLDAGRQDVRDALEEWSRRDLGEEGETWREGLVSPRKFARFAAHEIARLL